MEKYGVGEDAALRADDLERHCDAAFCYRLLVQGGSSLFFQIVYPGNLCWRDAVRPLPLESAYSTVRSFCSQLLAGAGGALFLCFLKKRSRNKRNK